MVSVCIAEYSARHSLNRYIVLDLDGHPELSNGALISLHPFVCNSVEVGVSPEPFRDLP